MAEQAKPIIAGSLVTISGDIIIGIHGTRITNLDDLSTYLEEHTLPGQTVNLTVVRDDQTMNITIAPGTQPQPSTSQLQIIFSQSRK